MLSSCDFIGASRLLAHLGTLDGTAMQPRRNTVRMETEWRGFISHL